ncbi:MAG TPA: cupin domain-containing protein [Pseudoxanthomonas sp.]|nr:cupin domain-containing protein [Pseudoxanthomonas sp.]
MHTRAEALIREFGLEAHPEGGHYRRVYASDATVRLRDRERPAVSAIRFLLVRGESSRWHRVDADEWWHWQEGDALELLQFDEASGRLSTTTLGDAAQGLQPMQVVPAHVWQAARPLGAYAMVGCTVSPGFVWEGFELLEAGSELAQRLQALI